MQTEREMFEQFRKFMEHQQQRERLAGDGRLPPGYHGPIDLAYIRPPATEFPKMVYKTSKVDTRGYITRVVKSQEEQDALPKGWLTTQQEIFDMLTPIYKQQYVTADDIPEGEQEEKEVVAKTRQAAKTKAA